IYADDAAYPRRNPETRLLLGTRYALLRREFARHIDRKRQIPLTAQKILVTLGGSDPNNVTLKILQSLELLNTGGLDVRVILGPAFPHKQSLERFAAESNYEISLLS